MDMSIDTSSLYDQYASVVNSSSNTSALNLANNIKADGATDKELLDACKQFEQYFIKQVMKEMKKTIPEDSLTSKNEYMDMFEDQMLDTMAETISDSANLGLAEQMYENLRLQYNTTNIKTISDEDAATTAEAISATAEARANQAAIEAEEEETKVQAVSSITNSVDI
ncbi:MAG: rod-binding protein [Lachnospiraceae bacterium]|nr:rod-binding protein [Lachnospiraceae bacterium]